MTDRRLAYAKVKAIGQGSYGVVHLVRGREDGKLYVMKVVKNLSGGDGKTEALHEVRMLEQLRHPNIVSFHEAFQSPDGRDLHIVMDYCDSGDLHDRIEKARSRRMLIPEEQVLDWFVQLALALAYLHSRHILHRDLKPQNVFLTNNNRVVKLGDFGITKSLEDTQAMAHTKIGTPYYFSPELCRDHPYSFPSDVWALGGMTYEMVCLRVPFEAENMPQLMGKILRTKPPAPTHHYSSDLRNLLGAMLAKSPQRRPTMQQILAMPFLRARLQALIVKYGGRQELPGAVTGAGVPEDAVTRVTTEREETPTGTHVTTTVTVTAAAPEAGRQLEPVGPHREPKSASREQFEETMARLLQEQVRLQERLKAKQAKLERAKAAVPAPVFEVEAEGGGDNSAAPAPSTPLASSGPEEGAAAPAAPAVEGEGEAAAEPEAAATQAAVAPAAGDEEEKGAEQEGDDDDGEEEDVESLSSSVSELETTLNRVFEEVHALEAEEAEEQEVQQVADLCRSTLTLDQAVAPHEPPTEPDADGVGPAEDGFDGQHSEEVENDARGSSHPMPGLSL